MTALQCAFGRQNSTIVLYYRDRKRPALLVTAGAVRAVQERNDTMTDITPNTPESQYKTCTKCRIEKPVAEFSRDKKRRDGLQYHCKACNRKYVEENAERIAEKQRAYYEENAEYFAEYRREYYRANAEKSNERSRRYRQENAESIAARKREYAKENAERIAENRRRYARENAESIAEKKRQYYQANVERIAEQHRRYDKENAEIVAARRRKYYEANYEKIKEKQRQHRRDHPEFVRAMHSRRRARIKAAGGTHTAADIRTQASMQTDKRGVLRCWWCSCAMADYHVDHRIALSRGGSNDASNICLACPTCNTRKQDKLPSEFNGRLL